ncbi:MAG TPA: triose-phosphate isomerase [Gaiellaceae bacterium]|jgi:triosephosphate isomerase
MLIAGNWKMFKGPAAAREFCRALRARLEGIEGTEIAVCPPYVSLAAAVEELEGSGIAVFAQNVHWADEGAFTGEVSAPMLLELGVHGALVAHSERRVLFGETDESAAKRVDAALAAGLRVIACVGESEGERDRGETEAVLERHVTAIVGAVEGHDRSRLVVAYEPVWAIGTGKVATPDQAQEAHEFIRRLIDAPVLYGGSVKPENAEEILRQGHVEGALVGGASLEVESFGELCEIASRIPS